MKIKNLLTCVLALCLASVAYVAQTSKGTVSGVVTDQNGAIVVGATITLKNTETNVSRNTISNNEGFYRFDAVDLGIYDLTYNAPSFGVLSKNGVVVRANQESAIDAQLQLGTQQITVDVTSDSAQLLQTETPVRGGSIESKRITELPFAGRNPVALALTLPGVSSNRYGFGVGTFSVNGSRGRSNNFLLNGTENNDISVAGQAFQITNPDAIQEVSVQTSNFDAEFGRAGGAVVNVITKGGTNSFHGTLGYVLDSTRDDAITNTQGLSAATIARGYPPAGTEQYFSGTLGGRIIKDRTFFFGSYQEQHQNSTTQFNRTVPSAAGLATLRSVFPVGANPRLDLYLGVISGVAATSQFQNISIGTRTGCATNPCNVEFGTGFFALGNTFSDRQITGRIDHKIGENDQFSANYAFSDQIAPLGGGVTFPGYGTANNNRYQNFQLSETHIFSNAWTNEARVAYNRILIDFPNNAANPLAQTLPSFSITTLSTIGVATNIPQGRIANNYLVQDTVTHIRGDHTFRFGFDILNQRSRQFAPIVERGLLTYTASTAAGAVPAFTGFANFLDDFSGSTGGTRRDFGSARYYPFLTRQAYFFQDRWRATQDLTLTLGVRYENFGNAINTLGTAAYTGLFNVDPITKTGPFSQPNDVENDNNNFAPAIGIAYSPSFENGFANRLFGEKKSVIRAGYQIGYDSFFNNIASNAATSSPNVVATSFVNNTATTPGRGTGNNSTLLPTVARPLLPIDSQTLAARDLVNPYYQRWSLGIQRSLPYNLVLDASYVGSKGTKLYINDDYNPSVPAALRITPTTGGYPTTCTIGGFVTAAQATPQFPTNSLCPLTGRLDNIQGSRLIRTNGGSSTYHSGQFTLSRRFTDNFTFTAAYTWSKLIDNASEVFGVAGNNQPQQAAVPSVFGGQPLERAVSLFDRPHRAVFTYVYELPFYRNQQGLVGRLAGGWQISGVTTFESGAPLTVVNGADADGIGGNLDRPIYNPQYTIALRAIPYMPTATTVTTANPCGAAIGALAYSTGPSATGECINPNNAQYIGILAGSGRTGNLGRNTLRTPGTNNFNVNLFKRVRLTENTRIEFRAEFYNIFNHLQYGQGSASPFSPGEAGIGASVTGTALGQFLDPTFADGGGRVIRYQLKFAF